MGTDKALIPWEGRRLVEHVAGRLATVADPVWLATGDARHLADVEGPSLTDAEPGLGPLAGIAAALGAADGALLAVVAVDMPWMSPKLIARMVELIGDCEAAVPLTEGGPQPLHAVYRVGVRSLAERALAEGRLSMMSFLSELWVQSVERDHWESTDPSGRFATNLNRPEDLAGLAEQR